MKERKKELPDAQKEKLEFVELLAYFNGFVIREDITNRFGVSPASATNILSRYNQMAPGNLDYDIRLKRYEISTSFKPIFDVRMMIERIPVYTMPKLHKPADNDAIEKIAVISRAIQRIQSLKITYSSALAEQTRDKLFRLHLPTIGFDGTYVHTIEVEQNMSILFSAESGKRTRLQMIQYRNMNIQRTIDNGIPLST